MYAEVVVNVIMYMFIRPAVDSHSMQLFVESRGNVKSVSCKKKIREVSISWKETKEQQQKEESGENST